ncbi:MAG: ribonuclease H-like domain-containing protein [Thermoplasmata archaeon]|nr:ribonuclease H-like domain-containing protein [Thermoplasmata archaeon]
MPGIGYQTEKRIWQSGIRTWNQCLRRASRLPLGPRQKEVVVDEISRSLDQLDRKNQTFFREKLPRRELWRAFPEFRDSIAYLDIETTGLSPRYDDITVIGLYDGNDVHTFVRGINLRDFKKRIQQYKLLVTYNGAGFDLRFIEEEFSGIGLDQIHIDLRFPLYRVGLKGGLKAIERTVGISRTEETQGLDGFDAVRLWKEYESGKQESLDLLVAYNREDIVNLEALMRIAYATLRRSCFL